MYKNLCGAFLTADYDNYNKDIRTIKLKHGNSEM